MQIRSPMVACMSGSPLHAESYASRLAHMPSPGHGSRSVVYREQLLPSRGRAVTVHDNGMAPQVVLTSHSGNAAGPGEARAGADSFYRSSFGPMVLISPSAASCGPTGAAEPRAVTGPAVTRPAGTGRAVSRTAETAPAAAKNAMTRIRP